MECVVDRIGICVENAYEAQLVLRKVNETYGGKKVKALFTGEGTNSVQSDRFAKTGMLLFKKSLWARPPKFVADESPIFEGIGAKISFGNGSKMQSYVTQQIGPYYVAECGSFVRTCDEGKAWFWNSALKSESELGKFLRSLRLYNAYYEKLKHLTLPEFATLCFMDGLKRDLATLVPDANDIKKIKEKLSHMNLPPRKNYNYGKFLTQLNQKNMFKNLPPAGSTMLQLLHVCNGMQKKSFNDTMKGFGVSLYK